MAWARRYRLSVARTSRSLPLLSAHATYLPSVAGTSCWLDPVATAYVAPVSRFRAP